VKPVYATVGTVMRDKAEPSLERDSIQALLPCTRTTNGVSSPSRNTQVRPMMGPTSSRSCSERLRTYCGRFTPQQENDTLVTRIGKEALVNQTSTNKKKALIVGDGIGSLVAAMALLRA
jgi:hypothetical protein